MKKYEGIVIEVVYCDYSTDIVTASSEKSDNIGGILDAWQGGVEK